MDMPTILVLGLAPGIFWFWYFYKKDKLEPEPKHFIIKTFFLGMVSAVPAVVLEIPFKGFLLTVIAGALADSPHGPLASGAERSVVDEEK